MPKFFLPPEAFADETVVLDGERARHISLSLRMAVGDPIVLSDGCRNDYESEIIAIDSKTVRCRIIEKRASESEPPCRVTLYQCLAKGEKMDSIIQKAVEYGVSIVVPVESERSIVRLSPESAEKKRIRWQKIADEAAGQCGRGILPQIHAPCSFSQAVADAAQDELAFLCYEGPGTLPLTEILRGDCPESVSFLIGPEGGISEREVDLAKSAGISLCGLGKRILRTESASGFVLSALSFRWEIASD